MSEAAKIDRYRGCFLGLEASEAFVFTVQFTEPKPEFFEPTEGESTGVQLPIINGLRMFNTAMAYWLTNILLASNGRFPRGDELHRDVCKYRGGRLGSTGSDFAYSRYIETIVSLERHGHIEYDRGASLARLAPLRMYYGRHIDEAIGVCRLSSQTTDGAGETRDACRYFAGLLVGALRGVEKREILSPYYPEKEYWRHLSMAEEIAEIAEGSFKQRKPPEFQGTGSVVEVLTAALWAFWNTRDFKSGALEVVELGDDVGVTAAIYGQIAGAYYGTAAIPSDWSRLCPFDLSYLAPNLYTNTIRHTFARLDW